MALIGALLLTISAYGNIEAVSLSQCGSDNTAEVVENRGDNTITCSGIPGDHKVDWRIVFPTIDQLVGSCLDVTDCTSSTALGYTATRPSTDRSVITINPATAVNWVRGGTLVCQTSKIGELGQSDSCRLDIVSQPNNVSCIVQPAPSGSQFAVAGRCDITKTYSSLNRYRCQWYSRHGSSTDVAEGQPMSINKIADNGQTPTGGTYINGQCDVTMMWPTVDATYSYRVVITPGGSNQDAGIIAIRKPDPKHDCPLYVRQGHTLTCTCSGDAGLPKAVLRWGTTSSSNLTVSNILPTHQGNQYQCQAVLNGVVIRHTDYTINVAYGPDSATINVPDPFDTDGSRDVILTCSTSNSNPSPTFSWTRSDSSEAPRQGESFMFRPQPPRDDGAELQCQAMNTFSNTNVTATATVNLHYPPTTDPVITNNSSDGSLYQGDSVTFTCAVTGGKPLDATSVTFTCPRTMSADGTAGSTGVTSSVIMTSVLDDDHSKQCTCNTTWKEISWYTKNIQTSLFVNTPPSIPEIKPSGSHYPPIAGVTTGTTLNCVSTTAGRPAASYTWTVTGRGQATSGQGHATLTFNTLSREDAGQIVRCKASNLYTMNRQPVMDGSFTLEVYYHPNITLSPQQDTNACGVNSQSICEVTEGQRVHFRCNAASNPAPAMFTWNHEGGNGTVLADLDITETNHTVHNRKYTCTVTTGGLSNNRQSLTSSKELTVLVKYKPGKTQITLNAQRKNLTINESNIVVLACQTDGRPTPNMEITGGPVAESPQGGVTVLEDRDTWYNYTLTGQCHHTGQYRCTPSNSVGEGPTDTAMLFVNCKPRKNGTLPLETPTVNYENTPQKVSFNLVAYPVPDNFTFSYLGPPPDNRSQPAGRVNNNTLQMACFTTHFLYNVTCNVTVNNITSTSEAGLYRVRVSNAFGHVDLEFMITFKESVANEQASPHSGGIVGGVIGGLAAALVAVGVVAVIVLFIIKKRKGRTNRRTEATYNRELPTPVIQTRSSNASINPYATLVMADVGLQSNYETVGQTQNMHGTGSNNPYATLVMVDVGLQSKYETVGQTQNVGGSASASPYDTLVMEDVGLKSVYETVGKPLNRPAP